MCRYRDLGAERLGLPGQKIDVAPAGQGDHLERLGVALDQVYGRTADGPGRAENGHPPGHGKIPNPSAATPASAATATSASSRSSTPP